MPQSSSLFPNVPPDKAKASPALSHPEAAETLYQLKIELVGSEPLIWRRFVVKSSMPLDHLNHILHIIMGWTGNQMHCFETVNGSYSSKKFHITDANNEAKVKLSDIAHAPKDTFAYNYDFGDYWKHAVLVEKVSPADKKFKGWAKCIEGKGACPPEDCGGVRRFNELVKAFQNPKSPDYSTALKILGKSCHPDKFDCSKANRLLASYKIN